MSCPYMIEKVTVGAHRFKCRITEADCITPEEFKNCIYYKDAWKETVSAE